MADDWKALASSLRTPIARRQFAVALTDQGLLDTAHLGGSLADAIGEIPESRLRSAAGVVAIDIALENIRKELAVLTRRAGMCFFASVAMAVALAAAILWSALTFSDSGLGTAQLLATLGSTAGGGATFAYYQYVSRQSARLREDLMRIHDSPVRRRSRAAKPAD